VLELDGELVELDEERLGVRRGPDLDIWVGDARIGVAQQASDTYDVVIGDAFGHQVVPWHLTTRELVADVRRVLKPGGVYALNIIDYPPARFIRAEAATLAAVFPHAALVAPPYAINGEQGANFVLFASDRELNLADLGTRLSGLRVRTSVLSGDDLRAFIGDARVLTDDFAPVDQLLNAP
jgi:spermidine synthase